jgi:uncharacterized protein (TIRG00374 family)
LTLPLSSLRWSIVLRALDIAIPFVPLFRVTCIANFMNQVLFGPTSADAVRGIYAWQILRRGSGRIAISIVVDRAFGLLALIIIAVTMIALRWDRVREVPEILLLALSLLVCVATGLAAVASMLAAPSLLLRSASKLQRYPRVRLSLIQTADVFQAFRRRPAALGAVIGLSLLAHCITIVSILIIAQKLRVGTLTALDVSVAAPLAMVANILPFTPGGLGVGEAAFDQVCRWLAQVSGPAPYATIFFAFRAVSLVMLVPGLIAFAVHRHDREQDH